MRYECRYIRTIEGVNWEDLQAGRLVEVVTGGEPRLETRFRACWTAEALHVRFECEDDHVVATMERRDDPIYEEDVVEVFLDTTGTGKVYYEFELSPRGVEFDAVIRNNLAGTIEADVAWEAKGFRTFVSGGTDGWRNYELSIPFADLRGGNGMQGTSQPAASPVPGTEWGWNLYRIDDDVEGSRHYWAWSPTGKVNFHVPQRFGTLVFV